MVNVYLQGIEPFDILEVSTAATQEERRGSEDIPTFTVPVERGTYSPSNSPPVNVEDRKLRIKKSVNEIEE